MCECECVYAGARPQPREQPVQLSSRLTAGGQLSFGVRILSRYTMKGALELSTKRLTCLSLSLSALKAIAITPPLGAMKFIIH